jgi:hypothetical protein
MDTKAEGMIDFNEIRKNLVTDDELKEMFSWFPYGGMGDRDGIGYQALEHVRDMKNIVLQLLDMTCKGQCNGFNSSITIGSTEENVVTSISSVNSISICMAVCSGVHSAEGNCLCEGHLKELTA